MKIYLPAIGPDLPFHPTMRDPRTGEPLQAIGRSKRGQIWWPIMGGSGEGDPDGDPEGDPDGDPEGDPDGDPEGDPADLGDAGKKALDTMKGQRNKARSDLRPWTAMARELGVKSPDELKALVAKSKGGDGDGQEAGKTRREAEAAAEEKANKRIIRSEVKAAAGAKLADPADAVRLLDLTQFEVDDDGEVDVDAINEAIDDLIKKKPYLAAQGGRRFQGGGDGGHRGDNKTELQPGLGRLQHAYAQSTKKKRS